MASQVNPVVVCGHPRSGTRMCANLLNNSPAFEIQGEIPARLAKPTLDWLVALRDAWGIERLSDCYSEARRTFKTVSKARALTRDSARWFGHKTPRHERWFDHYERLFDDREAPVRYVYCLRNPFDVWRSYRSMPWSRQMTVRQFAKSWLASVEGFEAMLEGARERCVLFNLDEMLAAEDRNQWVRHRLFEPLGAQAAAFRVPVDDLKNTNSSVSKFGKPPPEAPDADTRYLSRHRRIRRKLDEYFDGLRAGHQT